MLRDRIQKKEHRLLILLLLVTFIKGATWAALVPLWQSPDEYVHFGPVQFIAEKGRLPGPDEYRMSQELCQSKYLLNVHYVAFRPRNRQTFSEQLPNPIKTQMTELPDYFRWTSAESGCVSVSMHLPPLYYILGAGVYRLVYGADFFVRTFAIRLLSVVFTTITVLFSWLITREVFPSKRALRFTVAVAVSFQPMVSFLGSVINTDSLIFCLSTILIFISVRIVTRGLTAKRAVFAGVITGLGILTKPHIYAVVLALGIALLLAGWQQRREWRRWILLVGMLGLVTLCVGGWGIYRGFRLNNSAFYANPESEIWGTDPNPNYDWTALRFLGWYEQRLRTDLLKSYWGNFGWLDSLMPATIYLLIRWGIALSIIGIIVYITRKVTAGHWGEEQNPFLISVIAGLGVVCMFAFWGYIRMKTYGPHQPTQGRYLLSPVAAQMLLLVLGLVELTPRRIRPFTHTAIRVGFIGMNVLALAMVIVPRYYVLESDSTQDVHGWTIIWNAGGDAKAGVLVWPQQEGVTDLKFWINAREDAEIVRVGVIETGPLQRRYISNLVPVPKETFPVQLKLPDSQQLGNYPLFINVTTVISPGAFSSVNASTDDYYHPPVSIEYSKASSKNLVRQLSDSLHRRILRARVILGRINQLKPKLFQGWSLTSLFVIAIVGTIFLLYGLVLEPGIGSGTRRWLPLLSGLCVGILLIFIGFEIGIEPEWIAVPMSGTEMQLPSSPERITHDLVLKLNKPTTNIDDPHDFVGIRWLEIDQSQPAVWMHAPSSVTYRVDVPNDARLDFDLALDPETWNPDYGDGVAFIVAVVGDEYEKPIFWEVVDPKHNPAHQGWLPRSVDLSDYAGQTISLRLQTQPLGSNDWDWSMWGAPRIITESGLD